MYYRYELWIGDEFQEVGFLQGLDDTGRPSWRTEELLSAFDGVLPLPPRDIFKLGRTRSYFTEEGQASFADAIEDIIDAYEEDGLFEVECLKLEDIPGEIAYEDPWQVLVWEDAV